MKDNRLLTFLNEIRRQCRYMQRAIGELHSSRDPDSAWYAIQNLLLASGIASNLLWGVSDTRAWDRAERKQLRKILSVTEDNVLAARAVRHGITHIDERIGEYSKNQQGVTVWERIGGPLDPSEYAQPVRILRWYDRTSRVIGFGGDSVRLDDLASEAARLLGQCDDADPLSPRKWPNLGGSPPTG